MSRPDRLHPDYKCMVAKAIRHLQHQTGLHYTSRYAILKYITGNFNVGDDVRRVTYNTSQALKRGVSSGDFKLVRGNGVSGSFTLTKQCQIVAKTTQNLKVSTPKKSSDVPSPSVHNPKPTVSDNANKKQQSLVIWKCAKTQQTVATSNNEARNSSTATMQTVTVACAKKTTSFSATKTKSNSTPNPQKTPQPNEKPKQKPSTNSNNNDSFHFLHEVAGCLRRLPTDRQRAMAKMKILHTLYKIEFENFTPSVSSDNPPLQQSFVSVSSGRNDSVIKIGPDQDDKNENDDDIVEEINDATTREENNVKENSVVVNPSSAQSHHASAEANLLQEKFEAFSLMSPTEIAKKICEGELRLADLSRNKGYASPLWQSFVRVYYKKKGLTFASCKSCKKIIRYTYLRRNGKKDMLEHKC